MNPIKLIEEVSADLKKPAGDRVEFSSFESVATNRKDFVLRCHETWKRWHDEAVSQILIYDAFDQREKKPPVGPVVKEFGNYQRMIWRRVNDAIIWSLVGLQRHVVKRLCFYRKRSYLSESNAASVMTTIAELNSDPMSIAIWNDTTSCVDVGDVTYIKDGMQPRPTFLELKEGHVNEMIIDLIHGDPEDSEQDEKFRAFTEEYGKKGKDQFDRVLRQYQTSNQALRLLAEEKGTDPVTGQEMEILDHKIVDQTYDQDLNSMLLEAIGSGKEAMVLLAECVWVYVNTDKKLSRGEVWRKFQQTISEKGLHPNHSPKKLPKWDKDRSACLNESFFHPMAKPLFLRGLDPGIVAKITNNDLMFRVHLYLDWEKFASLVQEEGGEFVWSTEKGARRARAMKPEIRPPVVGGRVPQIQIGKALMMVTDPNLVEILFDGITPRTIVKRIVAGGASFELRQRS